MAGYVQNMLH